MTIQALPEDAIFTIYSFCDEKTAATMALVCKRFHRMEANYAPEIRQLVQKHGFPCLSSWIREGSQFVLKKEEQTVAVLTAPCRFEKRFSPHPDRHHLITFPLNLITPQATNNQ